MSIEEKIKRIRGPILVLGAGGFIGAALTKTLLRCREDVFGAVLHAPAWRLGGVPASRIIQADLLVDANLDSLFAAVDPKVVFNCVGYGAYPSQTDSDILYRTNFNLAAKVLQRLAARDTVAYVQLGGPAGRPLDGEYTVSKAAADDLNGYFGRARNFPGVSLRFGPVYGPPEDASRLVPRIGGSPGLPPEAVYIDDACEAFIDAALNLRPSEYGGAFDLTGQKNSEVLGWKAQVSPAEGLRRSAEWYRGLADPESYRLASKKQGTGPRQGISAVVACYKDEKAIPVMYERLKAVFGKLQVDYEIIFINDNSPDGSEGVIADLSRRDRRVSGISHSRNFGTQAGFRSGMEIATQGACVLLDGDLQDPPELIEKFVEKWREGYDVVYGRRIKRKAPFLMQVAYKLFYWLFNKFSYFYIPRDAGDFSLIDRKVVRTILRFPERDFFLRGVRAYVGFRQTGVDYERPERPFGVTTNNLWSNIEWAKKGILSFSYTPLKVLSAWSVALFLVSILLALLQTLGRLFFPDSVPKGTTTVVLAILFFGSANLLAQAVIGEYIAKIFEEVKRRPHFVRRAVIRDGEVRPAAIDSFPGEN